jgi:hypothetical protein
MAAKSDLKSKIDQLHDWLETNWDQLSGDDQNRGWDALITLQKQALPECGRSFA